MPDDLNAADCWDKEIFWLDTCMILFDEAELSFSRIFKVEKTGMKFA
jgi:hypothetical protein